jgi:hypothetical protein
MHLIALVWIGVILLLMPLQGIWSRRKLQKLRPTRTQAYASTISGLILMGVITLAVDWFSGRTGMRAVKNLPGLLALSRWAGLTFAGCAVI